MLSVVLDEDNDEDRDEDGDLCDWQEGMPLPALTSWEEVLKIRRRSDVHGAKVDEATNDPQSAA